MKNWSLNKKIWGMIGVLCVAFVCSSIFSVRELLNARDVMKEITENLIKRDQLTSEIKDNQRRLVQFTMGSILRTDEASLKKNTKNFEEVMAKQEADMKRYDELATAEGKALLSKYSNEYKSLLTLFQKAQALGAANKNAEATETMFSGDGTLDTMRGYINEMNKLTADRLKAVSDESNANASRAIMISALISIVSILASIMIAFFTLRALTKAISEIVRGLSDSSSQVSSASTQIASASEQLSQATTEQAASLEETAASVEEMNSMVSKNSENANSASQTSTKSQEAVNQGKQVVQRMIEAMDSINKSSEGMAEVVKVIEQIDKKTKVINEIVNKTELLSFNASVEAARAGEHGKGFAVVAEEVGNLARMSGSAAEEIATLLEESIGKVNQMVADTKKNVDVGAQITRECGEVFEEVVQNVSSVSGMATEIASASQEQSRGCAEITKAMSQLDQMTQQNAATSEECASAAEELSAQAEALKGAVKLLVVTVNGSEGQMDQMSSLSQPSRQAPAPSLKKGTSAKQPSGNVIHLKSPKPKSAQAQLGDGAEPSIKKASNDVPDYNSSGFNDI
jgi:methyl-accepting chemotaxis protein